MGVKRTLSTATRKMPHFLISGHTGECRKLHSKNDDDDDDDVADDNDNDNATTI